MIGQAIAVSHIYGMVRKILKLCADSCNLLGHPGLCLTCAGGGTPNDIKTGGLRTLQTTLELLEAANCPGPTARMHGGLQGNGHRMKLWGLGAISGGQGQEWIR